MYYSWLLLVLILSSNIKAQNNNTSITGYVPNAQERVIRLYTFTNFISYNPILIATDTVDSNSQFEFNLNLERNEVKTVFFALESYKSFDLFVEHGNKYVLTFDTLDYYKQDELFSPFSINQTILEYTLPIDSNELNQQIWRLTNELIFFNENQLISSIAERNIIEIESFILRIDTLFEKSKGSKFFNDFVEYALAGLKFKSGLYPRNYFVNKYFNDRPFLYYNPAFMSFFNSFFDNYINVEKLRLFSRDIYFNVQESTNYTALLDSLGKDSLLQNIVIRDMVLIKNLFQMYFNNTTIQNSIIKMLKAINLESRYKEHRFIANQLIYELTNLQKGNYKVDFNIKLKDKTLLNLKDFKGLYTYIIFFNTRCRVGVSELFALNNFYSNLSSNFNFVSISMDVNFINFQNFMNNNNFPWTFGNFNKNYEIEDNLQIKIYPHAILIDKDGSIIDINAPLPSEMLDKYLLRFMN